MIGSVVGSMVFSIFCSMFSIIIFNWGSLFVSFISNGFPVSSMMGFMGDSMFCIIIFNFFLFFFVFSMDFFKLLLSDTMETISFIFIFSLFFSSITHVCGCFSFFCLTIKNSFGSKVSFINVSKLSISFKFCSVKLSSFFLLM